MSPTNSREFDIIIFGASGLTGIYAIEELSRCVDGYPGFKWAIAGRNREKLKNALKIVQDWLPQGLGIRETPIVTADVRDPSSIEQMCKRTKLLLNCVGPYNIHGGEMVVSICVSCHTHYVDISAEIKYLDTVQAKYFTPAREAGVCIVGACGFGSLPPDYGIALLMKQFPGGLKFVEYFIELQEGPQGKPTGFGTYSSAVHSIRDYFKYSRFEDQVVQKVFIEKLVESNFSMHKLIKKLLVIYSFKERALCLNDVGPNDRTIRRSQMFRANFLNKKALIETQGYLKPKSILSALLHLFVFLLAAFVTLFASGRSLMEKYPSFFTAGIFTKEGPSRQQVLESKAKITFYAEGWQNKIDEMCEPNKKVKMVIAGPEAAYAFTAICMVQACLTVLFERQKIPLEGGVYTPGVAFQDTGIKEELEERGVNFTFEEIE